MSQDESSPGTETYEEWEQQLHDDNPWDGETVESHSLSGDFDDI